MGEGGGRERWRRERKGGSEDEAVLQANERKFERMRRSSCALCGPLSLLPETELRSQKHSDLSHVRVPLRCRRGTDRPAGWRCSSAHYQGPWHSQVAFWVLTRLGKKAPCFSSEAEMTSSYCCHFCPRRLRKWS